MVEGPVDEVVDVVPVRDFGMPAAGVVLRRALHGRARRRPAAAHLEDVLGDAGAGGRVEVPVVEIIGVIAMPNGPVTAARTVLVGMVVPVLHGVSPSRNGSIVRFAARGQAAMGRPA